MIGLGWCDVGMHGRRKVWKEIEVQEITCVRKEGCGRKPGNHMCQAEKGGGNEFPGNREKGVWTEKQPEFGALERLRSYTDVPEKSEINRDKENVHFRMLSPITTPSP